MITAESSDGEIRVQAQSEHVVEGQLEIVYNAEVSRSMDGTGAFVQAWVWVYYTGHDQ